MRMDSRTVASNEFATRPRGSAGLNATAAHGLRSELAGRGEQSTIERHAKLLPSTIDPPMPDTPQMQVSREHGDRREQGARRSLPQAGGVLRRAGIGVRSRSA